MFDACDPMLEARLAESVEAMMNCLHKPEAAALAEQSKQGSGEQLEMRVETVTSEELARLPLQVCGEDQELDLEGGVSAEYLSLLVDACTTGDDATQAASRALLQQDFAVAATSDLQHTTEALLQCLQDLAGNQQNGADEATHDRRAELCSAIAASIIVVSHDESHGEPELL